MREHIVSCHKELERRAEYIYIALQILMMLRKFTNNRTVDSDSLITQEKNGEKIQKIISLVNLLRRG